MNLVIDIGNTRIKAAVFEDSELLEDYEVQEPSELSEQIDRVEHVLVSSVRGELIQESAKVRYLRKDTPVSVSNTYSTLETLGADRLAAVIGANATFPNKNCLVIDCGTCITFDFIDADACYHGGSISPGLEMKFKALNNFTSALPLVEKKSQTGLIGDSTESSIQSGVINGTVAELEQMIVNYKEKFESLQVILTGGDANFFESKLKATIFVQPKIVLIGLNRILKHNVENT